MAADIADMSSSSVNRNLPPVLSSGECDICDAAGPFRSQEYPTIALPGLQQRLNTTKNVYAGLRSSFSTAN